MYTERSNGRYNNRTFPRDATRVWRGTGLVAVPSDASETVFEFRVWDPSRPMDIGRVIDLFSPDGALKNTYAVKSFGFSEEVGENETGHSTNCGVMVLELLRSKENKTKRPESASHPHHRRGYMD